MSIALALMAATQVAPADRLPLATIEIDGDPVYTISYKVEVWAAADSFADNEKEWLVRTWGAVRTSERGEQTISSEECPALSSIAAAFRSLPPIKPQSRAAVTRTDEIEWEPIVLHGSPSRVSFRTITGTEVSITGQASYTAWALKSVQDLGECWGPLIPTSTE